jgi:hypothetical protein
MNLELNPNVIGQRINQQEIIDGKVIKTIKLVVTNIFLKYDFKSGVSKYSYELSYVDGERKGWIHSVVEFD